MYDHQIWQADMSVEFDANETNQTVEITWQTKIIKLYYHSASAH